MIETKTARFRAILAIIIWAVPAFAQTRGVGNGNVSPPVILDYEAARLTRVVSAIRVTGKMSVDGHLEEPEWGQVAPAADFTTLLPRPGDPSRERTEVRFLYDDDNLYVGFICFDSQPDKNVVVLRREFGSRESDGVSVTIDALHDRRSGFQFGTNPAGAKRDSQISNNSQFNDDWEGVWDVKTSINDEGWIAEFVIPFKTLRFTQPLAEEWGVNMSRFIVRLNEQSFWSPLPPRYNMTRMSQAGTLKGIEGVHPGRNLKIRPFVTGGITQSRGADGQIQTLRSATRFKDYDGGVDAKYGLTPSLTLDATYRTDFAQVEVDQQQVNLTRFNLFFPEKRDFFLENAGTFNFGVPGGFGAGNSNLVPFFSRTIGLSGGTPVPIVGGARVSGKAGKYDMGFLAMKTESLNTGTRFVPANNYLVSRIKRTFSTSSWIGSLVTNRDSTIPGDYNRVYGTDAHFQFYDKLEFDSYLLKSNTPGKSGKDQARRFQTAWRADEFVASAEYDAVQTNFNPEMGFIRRKDNTQYSSEVSWEPRLKKSRTIRNLIFSTSTDYYEGGLGKVETRIESGTLGIQLQNGGNFSFIVNENFDRLVSTFLIRSTRQGNPSDLPILPGDYKYRDYSLKVTSSQRNKITGNGTFTSGEFWNGRRKSFVGTLNWRPNYRLNINLNSTYNRVTLPNGAFRTTLLGTRVLYGFSPRVFLNGFFQYNTDTHQFTSNIRFNVIHHPLSDLYIVYNDSRDARDGSLVERAFIVKFTNLFNF